ncbi:iron chelate uptake ABC transporter family permease subunit [Frankia sp. AgPm24]|uniref:FecCD family ABC transporter permease n=1 Tax=Frankia sp. AgPm24 TaxID=631128 RepID=UPI00200E5604|nr:iron chelate uptake ABC transporter family permease subunit [Frankia sp. AgPm24]MCK9922271.1 iron chelate uptake ABC transporter family permease subunit [Frankia sp. AgPm24]
MNSARVTNPRVTNPQAPRPQVAGPVLGAGRIVRVRRFGGDAVSVRISPRSITISAAFTVAVLVAGVAALTTGDYPIPFADVVRTLAGHGSGGNDFVVNSLRLPRLLTGLLVGAGLALSGSIFQSVSGNLLGSPDILGFTTGSATGAIVVLLVLHGTAGQATFGAVVGGVITGALVYLLAHRRGVAGPRLVLIGIAAGALLSSVNSYLITRAELADAVNTQIWLIGSLNSRGWEQVRPLAAALVVLVPLALWLGRRLAYLDRGADPAQARGGGGGRRRAALSAGGAARAAGATAAAGPIGFVALTAPPLARWLCGASAPPLVATALAGAALVAVSDLAAQRLFAPTQLPVGVATAVVGGAYLAVLLVRQRRPG